MTTRRRLSGSAALLAAAIAFAAPPAIAAERFDSSAGPIAVERVAGPFEHPWSLAFLPDGRKLVTERPGRLLLLEADGARQEVAGVPRVWASGQGGLLDVVPSPNFAESGLIFLSYSEPAGSGARTAAARARLVLGDRPRLVETQVVFRQSPVGDTSRHFGSRIVVAPDGALFVTTGDRGRGALAQDLTAHMGKVIRILPDGALPQDNPFARAAGPKPEIWSYGHRNIQGAAIEPATGALWTVEHGARGGDEVNRPEAGLNYGWPEISYGRHYSGARIGVGTEAPEMEQPVHYWDPSIAPSGMAFLQGDLFPAWEGDLLVGALKFQLIARLEIEDGRVVGEERLFEDAFGRIRDVRTGPDGAIWFLTDAEDGALYRAAPAQE